MADLNILMYTASQDTRSLFQLQQNSLEQRFQAFAEDYDTPNGRLTELADIGKIDKVPVYLINNVSSTFWGHPLCEKDAAVEKMA